MALTYSNEPTLGSPAPDFSLPSTEGKIVSLQDFESSQALVVVFMCNHCPYVIAVQERINELAKEFQSKGVALVGISSNDVSRYPDDSLEKMKERAQEEGFVFPYLIDETQEVAKAFGAVCTPDPFVYAKGDRGSEWKLYYHGRIDDNWKNPSEVTRRELAEALEGILSNAPAPQEQYPAMGCSIKWKD